MPRTDSLPRFRTPTYRDQLRDAVARALAEDIGPGDVTTAVLADSDRHVGATIVAKSAGVLAGADAATAVFRALHRRMRIRWVTGDGAPFAPGDTVAAIRGPAAVVLTGERTALNFLGHLSGIATATRRLVDAIGDRPARLLDTRKTTPGLRLLEKRAVRHGGGVNHRVGLYDAAMFKDNHLDRPPGFAANLDRIPEGVFRARLRPAADGLTIRSPRPAVCEVRRLAEGRQAIARGFHWLLLDNFTPTRLRHAVPALRATAAAAGRSVVLECSGNVTLRNIRSYAAAGVDFISVGAITHSAPSADFSLVWNG